MRTINCAALVFLITLPGILIEAGTNTTKEDRDAIVQAEFIYEQAPFPSCHASSIAESTGGLVAAWFGGTREKSPDVGIWISRRDKKAWSKVVEIANGVQPAGGRYPCWNPVLFQPAHGPLLLFYKVGPSPSA